MKILAIDTSTMMGSIALSDNDQLVAEYQIGIKSTYSDVLLPVIDHLLSHANVAIHEVDWFALALGPGSFTALRIGVSLVKGLALSLGKPIVGIPSLDGLAQNVCFSNLLICPLLNARKGEVYTAFYKSNDAYSIEKLTPDRAINPEKLLDEIGEEVIFLGDGCAMYREKITERLKNAFFAPPHLNCPRASSISTLASEMFKNNEIIDADILTPVYVRAPEAEVNLKKRI